MAPPARDLAPFRPRRWLRNPHLQTTLPTFFRSGPPDGPRRVVDVAVGRGSAVRVVEHRPPGEARGTLLLLHGLGGSIDSGYMVRTARLGLERGWRVVRMNMRNCGGTEALARTLYNAGQSDDVGRVLAALESDGAVRPFVTAGFSLGGNVVLRQIGAPGDAPIPDLALGVNPPVDLERCVRAIERPRNRLYQWHYVRKLRRQLEAVARHRALPAPLLPRRAIRTVRRFDGLYTAPDAGFPSAEAYYRDASADGVLARARAPAAILTSADDPFVPEAMFRDRPWRDAVDVHTSRFGGHCGYWGTETPRFWAAAWILARAEGVRIRRA